MKRNILIALFVLFFILPNVYSRSFPDPVWDIGPYFSYITYREPGVMKEEGPMLGVRGAFTYHDNFMIKLEGIVGGGSVDYEGGTWDGESARINDIPDYMLEGRVLGGWDFSLSPQFLITPFFGFGYRYLNDDMHQKDPGGYERESNYYYSPLGVEAALELGDGWSMGLVLEYDIFWRGRQISHLSDVSSAYNDPENDQDQGYGLRASLEVMKRWEKVLLGVEPFIRYWKIQDSDSDWMTFYGIPAGQVIEPRNNSTEIGVNLIVRF